MKKLVFNLLIFFGLPLIFFGVLEIVIFNFKDKMLSEDKLENIFREDADNYNWIPKVKSDSLIILAGSSSVRFGLSCNELNALSSNQYKYVNIAMEARDPIQTYFILKNIDLRKTSTIYFGLDPWIYSKKYYKNRNNYLYLDFTFIQILRFSIEHDNAALLKRYKNILTFFYPKILNNSSDKNIEIPENYGSATLERKPKNFNEPVATAFQIDKYGWSDLQFAYLKKIIKICNDKNIKFVLFIPPKRSDYTKDYKENCLLIHHEFIEKLDNLNSNVPIFGKFDQLDNLGDFENFAEPFHLNKTGQSRYSKLFYQQTSNNIEVFSKKHVWFNN